MMRRVSGATSVPLAWARFSSGASDSTKPPTTTDKSDAPRDPGHTGQYSEPVLNATGMDNRPGIYGEKSPESYFEKAYPNNKRKLESHSTPRPNEPKDRSDNIKVPEFDTAFGQYETSMGFSGGPANHRYQKFVRKPADTEAVNMKDVVPSGAIVDHHPHFNYTNTTGKKEGGTSNMVNTWLNWDIQSAKKSLYRACLKSIPLAKHFYYLSNPIDRLKQQVRLRFLQNRNVQDPDAIRHLLHNGWTEYQEVVMMRRTRTSLQKFFSEDANTEFNLEHYANEEGKGIQERRFWNGEEQRKEGPYDGFWSRLGKEQAEEFERLAGRVPTSWSTSKGYFEKFKPDGTNYWEKNMDYEGWYLRNVNPDTDSARKDIQAWTESGYNQPKHYASKNRRGYRRLVKDLETIMQTSIMETYSKSREQQFQYFLREQHPESNRIAAERKMAQLDDEMFTTKWDDAERCVKQVMREMPNPRLWKTDAFYFRLRYLMAPYDENWAKVPVGTAQEKLFAEWVSDNANYAILNSKQFAAIKADKSRNPMAWSLGDFYTAFDPDVPETRRLPWYHPDFDYDLRTKWDERCMRMKKWVQSGNVEVKLDYFSGFIAEWEQYVNRPERYRANDNIHRRYASSRMVQLYRALSKVMDVALANQIRSFAASQLKASSESLSKSSADDVSKMLEKVNFADFRFQVPSLILPDGYVQPQFGLDGSPIGPIPEQPAKPAAPQATAEATA